MGNKLVKEKMIVVSNYDVEVEGAIKEEIQNAVKNISEECSKKYMRNVKVTLNVDVK